MNNNNKQSISSAPAPYGAGWSGGSPYLRLSALCAASEHCIHEMREKMRRWEIGEEEQEKVIERLVKEKFIDEERYCRAFIADKIRYNKWGRRKIEQALMMKRIAQDTVQNALNEVDEEEYLEILRPLIAAKRRSVKAKSEYELDCKLIRFAVGRGFLMDEIRKVLEEGNE